jgi:hypothetical protein
MAERPLLAMPRPERRTPRPGRRLIDSVPASEPVRQAARVGPKFQRLEDSLGDPGVLAQLRDDPAAIVPERALVFEVASDVVDFYQAVRGVPGFEFLGEDEGDAAPDEDFFIPDKEGRPRPERRVPRRFYFTIPDQAALSELVSLWRRYQRGEELGRGRAAWRRVFGHLADIRPWGPRDRLTEEAIRDWRERLELHPDEPVRFEVEFWYRDGAPRRETAETAFTRRVNDVGGRLIDRAIIDPIRYHAALVEVAPDVIEDVLANPEIGLVAFDDVMVLRPQSMVSSPVEASLEHSTETEREENDGELGPPIAALLDGAPMAQHDRLTNRLVIDDPEEFSDRYGTAAEQRHGTAMASLILHGDLNVPDPPPPVRRQLYVRPVMYPQPDGLGSRHELMPPDRLGIDLMWRAFIRMFNGEGSEGATAPTVRIVNLSLGDTKRRFAGVMSPWARLIDYLSWTYGVLVLVSAGNISDRVLLDDVATWAEFEGADGPERQAALLRAILRNRASRRLLSPSESINALTIGAAHADHVAPNGHGALAVDPYVSACLPNPSSALGLGFKRTVKPEILFPGGAEHVRANANQAPIEVQPVAQPARYFGIGAASPGAAGETNRKLNMSGTSVATALATHQALRILEALDELPVDAAHPSIEPAYHALLLKALLVHGARWDRATADALESIVNERGRIHWEHARDEVSRFLGFGCADVDCVMDCTANRATLIGWNTIHARETDRFQVPLPAELEGITGFRALCVTIAWLTPITHSNRMYRLAKFRAEPGGDKAFSLGVGNSRRQPSHNALGKGTVYHHRWEGEEAAAFVDDGYLILDVTCSPAAGELDDAIPYAIVVSLEVGAGVAVPVYERIRERLREVVRVRA